MKRLIVLLMIFANGYLFAQDLTTIAVLDLTSEGLSDIEARLLTKKLRSNLVSLNLFTIVDRENMEEILDEQAFQLTGCTSEACVVQIGQLLGVQKMISGSVGKIGRLYMIQLSLTNIENGKIERSTTYNFQGEIEMLILEGMDTALLQLFGLTSMATGTAASATQKNGSLSIESIPNHCEVKIDGLSVGTTPLNLPEIAAGVRTISISGPGLQTYTGFLNVEADTENVLAATLKSIYSIVNIQTDVADAKIYFNDAFMAEGSLKNDKINRGNYRVRIEHPRYKTDESIAELNANDTLEQKIRLQPRLGQLELKCYHIPVHADISYRGKSESFYLDTVKSSRFSLDFTGSLSKAAQIGEYNITLSSPGYYPINGDYSIAENETNSLHYTFIDGRPDYALSRKSFKRNSVMTLISALSGAGLYVLTSTLQDKYLKAMTVKDADALRAQMTAANIGSAVCFSLSAGFGLRSAGKYIKIKYLEKVLSLGETYEK